MVQNKEGQTHPVTRSCVALQQGGLQKCSMRKASAKWLSASVLSALLLVAGGALAADDADAGPWNAGANSRARLLAAGPLQAGLYTAGLEIELKGAAHTYWRDPGDAGVPPLLSTEGSRNVKSARLRFPAPQRIDENGLMVNGYRSNLVLPLEVIPQDAKAPVHLALRFTYAACEKICVPADLSATLDLTPDAPPSAQAGRLADARRHLPQPIEAAQLGLSAQPLGAKDKPKDKLMWRLALPTPARDLFVEGPSGWFFETRPSGDGFDITAAERPKDWTGPVPVMLTVTGAKDYEVGFDLPLP